jgi:hypothetical protein
VAAPPSPPPNTGDSLREKAMLAFVGFLLTGVLGAVVTGWIQQRGWAWQNQVAKVDKDTQNALGAYQSASDLINARWHATYSMVRAIDRGAVGDEWKDARTEFAAADKDWAVRYTSVARDVAFYVDTPFAVDAKDRMKLVWPLPCNAYALGAPAGVDPSSARLVLEVVNHCAGLVKDEIDQTVDPEAGAPPKLDAAARKAFADPAYARLDAIYKTNEALRCIIFTRALAIRQSLLVNSYWGSFFGLAQPGYARPDEKDCLG